MGLQTITADGMLHWQCYGGEEDAHCLAACSAHASAAVYRPGQSGPRGALIDLPACSQCGARCSLKADYSPKELFKATLTIMDTDGGIVGYALKIPHVHNLMLHHWLYQHGYAEHAPVLPMPTQAEISDPRLARLPGHVALALWFGYAIVKQHDPRLANFDMVARELAALPTLPALESGDDHATLN
jgi:hypothetical protein